MGDRSHRARPVGAFSVLSGLLAAVLLLAACGTGAPRTTDPLSGASAHAPALPPNVGVADCDPPSQAARLASGLTEIHGAAERGSLWAKVGAERPFKAGAELHVVWRIPGGSQLRLVAVGPGGLRISPSNVAPASARGWARPGDAWTSTFRFPTAGCWRINADRGRVHGDVWLVIG